MLAVILDDTLQLNQSGKKQTTGKLKTEQSRQTKK
jgi:hypothetical protein